MAKTQIRNWMVPDVLKLQPTRSIHFDSDRAIGIGHAFNGPSARPKVDSVTSPRARDRLKARREYPRSAVESDAT